MLIVSISGLLIYMLKCRVSVAISGQFNVLISVSIYFVLKHVLKYTFSVYISGKINNVLSVSLSGHADMSAETAHFSMAFS
jgi:hypothetical protein